MSEIRYYLNSYYDLRVSKNKKNVPTSGRKDETKNTVGYF